MFAFQFPVVYSPECDSALRPDCCVQRGTGCDVRWNRIFDVVTERLGSGRSIPGRRRVFLFRLRRVHTSSGALSAPFKW